jgi:hypothetical protein
MQLAVVGPPSRVCPKMSRSKSFRPKPVFPKPFRLRVGFLMLKGLLHSMVAVSKEGRVMGDDEQRVFCGRCSPWGKSVG